MDELPKQSTAPDRFREGVVWTLASLGVLALSGLALNVLIGRLYDAATLGIFNQVLALYIIFSMLAVGGVNMAALKRIAEAPGDADRTRAIAGAALVLTLAASAVFTLAFWCLRGSAAAWLNSPGVGIGMAWITPGLFCFGLNKTLLGIVNGLGRMRTFAVFQALRYLNLLTGFGLAVLLDVPGECLAFVFSFSEGILLAALLITLRGYWRPPPPPGWRAWLGPHLRFGCKGIFSGMLLELNSRVDVLMLGLFLTDRHTGIYSFAAFVYEGFIQIGVVLQTNYNPRLSRTLHDGGHEALETMFRRGRATVYRWALPIVPLLILGYVIGVRFVFGPASDFQSSCWPFAILMAGLLAAAGYLPFQQILVMGDRPGWHTGFMLHTVVVNIILNALLIPRLGLNGAALATALTLISSNLILILLTRRLLGVDLR